MNPSRLLAIAIVCLVLLSLLALLTATPDNVLADNNAFTFQGQYTAPACGPRHDFTIGPNTRTIDVVASTVPVNDIVLKLYYGGQVISQQDTGTSPEPIHYGPGSNLAPGTYQVEVCPFGGQAVLTPSDYAGVIIVTEAPVPGTSPPATNPIVLPPAPDRLRTCPALPEPHAHRCSDRSRHDEELAGRTKHRRKLE
jgi:hypothetical protein